MNPAHLHLLVNHLPIVGLPLVAALLGAGLWRRSRELIRAALVAALTLAVLTWPVFLTGDGAEERIEKSAWVSETLIHEHEERAETALIAVLATGAVALAGLWQSRGGRNPSRGLGGLTLAGLVASAGLLGWTALAGGQIRHEEIRSSTAASTIHEPAAQDQD